MVKRLLHTRMRVNDLERTVRFYEHALGLTVARRNISPRGAQIVFLDTPGLHEPRHLLNRRMVRTTLETFEDADVLYVVVDATSEPGPGDLAVIGHVREAITKEARPVVLVINKVDLVNKMKLLPRMEQYARLYSWTEVVPLSAETGDNVDRLLSVTVGLLPEGEAVYGDDMVTDQSMRTLASELIREKILQQTYEEIPHSVAVEIEEFQETKKMARITAAVLVEKESQKGILIGKHGERLKQVGTEARRDMERIFGMKVFLQLWVKVRGSWREDERVLMELGY